VHDIVGELKTEVGRIDEIVRAILAFSRPLADERPGGLSLQEEAAGAGSVAGADGPLDRRGEGRGGGRPGDVLPRPFRDYRGVLDRVRSDLERVQGLEEVRMEVEIEPDVPAVHAHPQHLERILSNLCRNAAQALAGRADAALHVRVTTTPAVAPLIKLRRDSDPPTVNYAHRRRLHALLQVQGAPPPRRAERDVVMEVTDNGPGIPEHVMSEIFDPFFTTREPGKGVGLGLALTARIVGELGGQVEAENRPEGGACFRVRIPGAAEENGGVSAETSGAGSAGLSATSPSTPVPGGAS
jgi:signal transduction histidine kinase